MSKKKRKQNKKIRKQFIESGQKEILISRVEEIMNDSELKATTMTQDEIDYFDRDLGPIIGIKKIMKQTLKEARVLYPIVSDHLGDTKQTRRAFSMVTGGMIAAHVDRLFSMGLSYNDSVLRDHPKEHILSEIAMYATNKIKSKFFKNSFSFGDLDSWFNDNIKRSIDRILSDTELHKQKVKAHLREGGIDLGRMLDHNFYRKVELVINEYSLLGEIVDYIMKNARGLYNNLKEEFNNSSQFRTLFANYMASLMETITRQAYDIIQEQNGSKEPVAGLDRDDFAYMAGGYVRDTFLMEFFRTV